MRKKGFSFVSVLVFAALALSGCVTASLSSCSPSSAVGESSLSIEPTEDKYGTFYEVFPYSFADSNGDGIGDLAGIKAKVDYIDSLHYDGVWLNPVHPSESYHKYDVDDYEAIDPAFGTLADYDALVDALHAKGMKILLDLVFNHTSISHPWFSKCLTAHYNGQTGSHYYNYYNVEPYTGSVPVGYARATNYPGFVYECRFWSGMPDLNLGYVLSEPEGNLATDLKDIMRFWLVDHDVDGFRLDAVTSYFTGNQDENAAFLKWLHDYCISIKPNVYIVGEGSWGSPNENLNYQTTSGVDSFFNFEDANSSGYPCQTIIHGDASYLYDGIVKNLSTVSSTGLPAPFISNHDTGRLYGAALGAQRTSNLKFAHAVLQMMNGCTFVNYGDEAGMKVCGSKDEDIRQPMPWGDSYECTPVASSTAASDADKYPLGTVEDQLSDPASLINFAAKANLVRRAFPAIARGTPTDVYESEDAAVGVIRKDYDGASIYIAVNASPNASESWDFGSVDPSLETAASLVPSGALSLSGTVLTLPAQSIAILK